MFANQIAVLRQFQKREDGVVAIVFALALIGILLIVGLAIDVGRAVHATTRLETALDAAALAGAKGLRLQNLSEGETRELAERLFRENVSEQDRT
ncbi:MAG: pilus assembly protein TadG-related protein, partial [Pseudomonadota bacterium]